MLKLFQWNEDTTGEVNDKTKGGDRKNDTKCDEWNDDLKLDNSVIESVSVYVYYPPL